MLKGEKGRMEKKKQTNKQKEILDFKGEKRD
jgi:hypothetical protein